MLLFSSAGTSPLSINVQAGEWQGKDHCVEGTLLRASRRVEAQDDLPILVVDSGQREAASLNIVVYCPTLAQE
jgi:hypothetical protein